MSRRLSLLPFWAATLLSCSSESSSAPEDVTRPVVLQFYGPPGNASPGDTLNFNFIVRDSSVGNKYVTLRIDGAFTDAYSFELETTTILTAGYVWMEVPSHAEPLRTAVATLIVSNEAGLSHQKTFSVPIWDVRPPAAQMTLGGLRGDGTIGTGQTLDIYVNAADNHRLTYLGYAGGGQRDSVPASGTDQSHVFRLAVPAHWTAPRPVLTAWARDESGNVSVLAEGSWREAPVFDWRNRPMVIARLASEPPVAGVLWDAARGVAYVLLGDRIEVIQPTGAFGTTIVLPAPGESFAFTESGDSLVVVLRDQRALGVIDLRPATRTTSVLPLQYQDEVGKVRMPKTVLVSGRHVFVTLVHGLYAGRLLDVDLVTGTQIIRTDFTDSADIESNPSFFRLPDGRLYLTAGDSTYYNLQYVYSPATDRFARTYGLRPAGQKQFSGSASGRFLLGNIVYEPALYAYVTLETQDWREDRQWPPVAALAHDGASVFLATVYGYSRFNLTSRYPSEQVKLGTYALSMLVTPDGSLLIATGGLPGSSNTGDQAVMFIDIR